MPHKDLIKRKKYFREYDKARTGSPRRRNQIREAGHRFRQAHPRTGWVLPGFKLRDKRNLYKKQQGRCAACGEQLPTNFRKAHTDHRHGTNIVRGLLHWYCNFVVGYEESHPGILKNISRYIRRVS